MLSVLECSLLKCNFAIPILKSHFLHQKLVNLQVHWNWWPSISSKRSQHSSSNQPSVYKNGECLDLPVSCFFQDTNTVTFCSTWFDQVHQFTLGGRIFTDNRFSGHKKKRIWIPATYFPTAWSLFMPLCSWDGCLWCSHCSPLGAKCTGPTCQAQAVIHLPTRCQEVIKIKTPFLDVAFYSFDKPLFFLIGIFFFLFDPVALVS